MKTTAKIKNRSFFNMFLLGVGGSRYEEYSAIAMKTNELFVYSRKDISGTGLKFFAIACNQISRKTSHGQRPLQRKAEILSEQEPGKVSRVENRAGWLSLSSFVFAIVQSACAFVVATSSIRVLIGLGSLAAAAGTDAPVKGFHQDAIRIPMMIFSLLAALLNLYALWRVRSLRKRASSQWRVKQPTAGQIRSEWLQITLSVLALVLLAAEWWAHAMLHHPHP
jgi:hypothetical protein